MNTESPGSNVLSMFDVAPRRIGGVEMLAAEISRSLTALGWQSRLVFPAAPTKLVAGFFQDSGAEILIQPDVFQSGVAGARALFSLVRKTKTQQLNLSFVPVLSLLPWTGKLAGAKNVFFTDQGSRGESDDAAPARGAKRLIGRFLAEPYTHVFCVSDFIRADNTTRGYISPQRLSTLYNGIDFHRIADAATGAQFRRSFNISPDKILVSQVSWLRPEKGLDVLIRAAALAIPQDPRLHFLIAGDGPCRAEYVELCKQLGIEQAVTFAGLIDDPMGAGLYAASDMTTQLSRWKEACAFVICEAMAHAKPMIGTRVGGIPEAIQDGVNGFLVPPSDPPAVAQRLLELSKNEALRTQMGRAAYERALRLFNLTDNVATLLTAFGALKESGAKAPQVAPNTL